MDLMNIMRMAQEAKKNSDQIQSDLEQMTITGTAGGGMVSADVSGLGIVKRVKIDRSVVNPDDIEMLEDLITVAVSEAQKKAQDEQKLRMSKLTEGLGLPANLPFKLPF
jgi:DNA-binding YbaB/EbfC family protein